MREISEEMLEEKLTAQQTFCLYVYTPMCGTCQVASKMLTVVEAIKPAVAIFKINMNYSRILAERFEIESVPCLLFFRNGEMQRKIYAFQSVPFLLDMVAEHIG
ncbi:MAG: thioredoxin family protein [Bacillus sp. (in: firmicutes)]